MLKAAFAGLFLLAVLGNAEGGKIIIDTDGLVDDARALILALRRDSTAEVLAITTVASTVSIRQATANVNRVLRLVGRSEVPVHMGATDGILKRGEQKFPIDYGRDGFGDRPNTDPSAQPSDERTSTEESAAEAMVRLARTHKGEITIISLGPLTNVAIAQKLDSDFGQNIRALIAMGGNFLGVGNMPVNPCAEYAFHMDPEAAHIVLNDIAAPKIVTPWETVRWRNNGQAWKFLQDSSNVSDFLNRDTPVAYFLKSINHQVLSPRGPGFMFFDEIAVAIYLNPKVITRSVDVHATVELHGSHTRGEMVVDWINRDKPKNVKVIIQYDPKLLVKMMNQAVE